MFVLCSRVIRSSRLLDSSHLVAAVFAEVENALLKKLPLWLLQLEPFFSPPNHAVSLEEHFWTSASKSLSASATPFSGKTREPFRGGRQALRFVCCVVFVSALVEPTHVPWFLFQCSWERGLALVQVPLCFLLVYGCLCEPPSAVLVPDELLTPDLPVWDARSCWSGLWCVTVASWSLSNGGVPRRRVVPARACCRWPALVVCRDGGAAPIRVSFLW